MVFILILYITIVLNGDNVTIILLLLLLLLRFILLISQPNSSLPYA